MHEKLAGLVNSKSPVGCGLQNPVNPPGDSEQTLLVAWFTQYPFEISLHGPSLAGGTR